MTRYPETCCIVPNLGVVPVTLSAMLALDRITAVLLRDLAAVAKEIREGARFEFIFVDIDVFGSGSDTRAGLAQLRAACPEVAVIALSSRIEDDFRPAPEAGYDAALHIPVCDAVLDLARIQARVNRSLRRALSPSMPRPGAGLPAASRRQA